MVFFGNEYISGAYRICRVSKDAIWLEFRHDGSENQQLPKEYTPDTNEQRILHDGYVTGVYEQQAESPPHCFVVKVYRSFHTTGLKATTNVEPLVQEVQSPVSVTCYESKSAENPGKRRRTKRIVNDMALEGDASVLSGLARCESCQRMQATVLVCTNQVCALKACCTCRRQKKCCAMRIQSTLCAKCSTSNGTVKKCVKCLIKVCSVCRNDLDVCIRCFKAMKTLEEMKEHTTVVPAAQATTKTTWRRRKKTILIDDEATDGAQSNEEESNDEKHNGDSDFVVADDDEVAIQPSAKRGKKNFKLSGQSKVKWDLLEELSLTDADITHCMQNLNKNTIDGGGCWTRESAMARLLIDTYVDEERDRLRIPGATFPRGGNPLFYTATGILTSDPDQMAFLVLPENGSVIGLRSRECKDQFICFFDENNITGFAPANACGLEHVCTEAGEPVINQCKIFWRFLKPNGELPRSVDHVDMYLNKDDKFPMDIPCALVMSAHLPQRLKWLLVSDYRTSLHEWETSYNPHWLNRKYDNAYGITASHNAMRNANAKPSVQDGLEFYYVRSNWIWRTALGRYIMDDYIMVIEAFGQSQSKQQLFELLQVVCCSGDTDPLIKIKDNWPIDTCDACGLTRTLSHVLPSASSETATLRFGSECALKLRYVFQIIQLIKGFREATWKPQLIERLMHDLVETRDDYHKKHPRFTAE